MIKADMLTTGHETTALAKEHLGPARSCLFSLRQPRVAERSVASKSSTQVSEEEGKEGLGCDGTEQTERLEKD